MDITESSDIRELLERGEELTYLCLQLAVEVKRLRSALCAACRIATLPKFEFLERTLSRAEKDLHVTLEYLDTKLLQIHRLAETHPQTGDFTMAPTLYERLGGKAAVEAAVDLFYDKIMKDDLLRPFFEGIDMQRQRGKQKIFLTTAFGGPTKYTGKDLRQAHAPLVQRGLNDAHFDAVAGHLQMTLKELGVADNLIAEVMAIAGSTRNDVLGR